MKDDETTVRKNRPVQAGELPDWANAMPAEERERYVHSPHCKVCNATHNGRNLRQEIEGLVIEKKTYPEVCNIMYDRYGLELRDYNVMNHMAKHAPNYAKVLEGLMESELGELLSGSMGPIVDQYKFLLAVLQVALHRLLRHPDEVTVSDGIRAAEKFHLITEGLNIRHGDDMISQQDITTLLDIIQTVMTPEQREEVSRRFGVAMDREPSPSSPAPAPEPAPGGDDSAFLVEVDGEVIDIRKIPTLPPEEPGVAG